jgi:ABC-type transport system involved in multi-copper enzyme maturation permease subunit
MIGKGPVLAIAHNTVRDTVRNRVLYVLLFFALVMIAASAMLSTLSYVERDRILQDVGFSAIRFFGASIAIFMGVGLVHREMDRRTIFTILSKPVTRAQFIVGKYLGLLATLWMQLAIMGASFALVSYVAGAPFDAGHLIALALIGVELAVVVSIATLFSSFATPFLAASYSLGLYLIGHLTRDLRAIGEAGSSEGVQTITVWIHRVLPDLSSFNRAIEAVHGLPIPSPEIGAALLAGLAWCVAFLGISVVTFARRDFR